MAIEFGYTLITKNDKGLEERHSFILPRPDDADASVNKQGLIVKDGELCGAEVRVRLPQDPEIAKSVAQQLRK
jgi:hypothetical protein